MTEAREGAIVWLEDVGDVDGAGAEGPVWRDWNGELHWSLATAASECDVVDDAGATFLEWVDGQQPWPCDECGGATEQHDYWILMGAWMPVCNDFAKRRVERHVDAFGAQPHLAYCNCQAGEDDPQCVAYRATLTNGKAT